MESKPVDLIRQLAGMETAPAQKARVWNLMKDSVERNQPGTGCMFIDFDLYWDVIDSLQEDGFDVDRIDAEERHDNYKYMISWR